MSKRLKSNGEDINNITRSTFLQEILKVSKYLTCQVLKLLQGVLIFDLHLIIYSAILI